MVKDYLNLHMNIFNLHKGIRLTLLTLFLLYIITITCIIHNVLDMKFIMSLSFTILAGSPSTSLHKLKLTLSFQMGHHHYLYKCSVK